MELYKINSLVELFFKKFEQITSDDFEKINSNFLISLKEKNKGNKLFSYSWGETNTRIRVLSNYLNYLNSLLLGGRRENRTLTSCETRF